MAPPPFALNALFPCNPYTERGVATKLHVSKDGKLVYPNGRTVIIRDLKEKAPAKAYAGHARTVSVARFSPSGFYCASADVNGTVRVWDTVGEDNVVKGEYPAISGRINDLAWDGESKRIIAVGDGRETFGKAFMFDTGSSTGEISGHTKVVNAVSIRQQRPFKAATASDDATIVFHSGVPFKFEKIIKTHTKFVQDVKFSPSGDYFASVGSDAKAFLYDGKTGETVGELSGDVHKGSITAASWSPDGKTLATSSMDRTVKLWDVERKESIQTWTLGSDIASQQMGNAWGPDGEIVSLSMSGSLNIFDQRTGDAPARVLLAPQKAITTAVRTASGTFLAGVADGRIVAYDTSSGKTEEVGGTGHKSFIKGIASVGDTTLSIGFDDTLREISSDANVMTETSVKLQAQPRGLALGSEGTAFVSEINTIEAFRQNQRVAHLELSYEADGIATTGETVAVGGNDNKIHLYAWDGTKLNETGALETPRGAATTLAFSPDQKLLVAGDTTGKITLFDVKLQKAIENRWTNHAGRITTLAWAPTGQHIASGSLDSHVFVWSIAEPLKTVSIRLAGPGGVNAVAWLDNAGVGEGKGLVASAGADGCVRVWEVKLN